MRKPCCDKQDQNKGAWSKEEDQKLFDYVQKHGEGNWRSLPRAAGLLRCGKSCRLRWLNYLRPDLKRGNFSEDEEDLIIKLHALLGNRWSLIAGRLPGRTDNEVKNYWNSHIRKKLISMGVDPSNHRLRLSTIPSDPQQAVKSIEGKNEFTSQAEKACGVPDLNLSLAVSNLMEDMKHETLSSTSPKEGVEGGPSCMLLLFK